MTRIRNLNLVKSLTRGGVRLESCPGTSFIYPDGLSIGQRA